MSDMEHRMEEIREALSRAVSDDALQELRVRYLGKKGEITAMMKQMRNLSPEERPAFGSKVNALRAKAEEAFAEKTAELREAALERRLQHERIDVTLPGKSAKLGAIHPLNQVYHEVRDIFAGMGFSVVEGPEVEFDHYNFEMLNIPKDHPARDMQDTFYLSEEFLLRTQTSGGQIRTMDVQKPPIKILMPGRVFRSDSDATHSPMFHQMEGLVVDKGITLGDLQGALNTFVQKLFGADTRTRLRPSYFPFTEPSVEVDVSCFECHGKGCPLCKHTGWIEVLGGGVVNRKVLENCNIDPDEYSGFAFGIGIERIAMLKYGINNIGLMFENNLQFLKQFHE